MTTIDSIADAILLTIREAYRPLSRGDIVEVSGCQIGFRGVQS